MVEAVPARVRRVRPGDFIFMTEPDMALRGRCTLTPGS